MSVIYHVVNIFSPAEETIVNILFVLAAGNFIYQKNAPNSQLVKAVSGSFCEFIVALFCL